ncbi:hypothetical protein [Prosthecomicrobium pneumaticum]|uniref:Uncharacterized protein n=1 Tax=Prosthecomicrobium pneumaticum TaxID=81895 RepID=A0A7W9CU64_9HYPH|nr:hypothetical protein [Prosthecomicrobium pneumaticum]MBB5751704.1 hypothetical protein [Prosthecomicrobium pneumaticum]
MSDVLTENVVAFVPGRRPVRSGRAGRGPCEIVIFPGVRVERAGGVLPPRGAAPGAKPAGGRLV